MRAARAWEPLNRGVTTGGRAVVRRLGVDASPFARFLPRVGVVEAPLPNGRVLKMWSRGDDEIASSIFWKGWDGHESETAPIFYDLASSARVTVDVGAHVGYFALLAALANPAGRVYAFEPLPRVYERLEGNIRLNGVGNVECLALAVGDKDGTAPFFHVNDGIPSSSSLSRDFMVPVAGSRQLSSSEVGVTILDDFLERHGVDGVDLVKIDTEGTALEVLSGMSRTLKRCLPDVICEVLPQDDSGAIEETFFALHYRCSLLTDEGPRPCDHIVPDARWRNFLFQPPEGSRRMP